MKKEPKKQFTKQEMETYREHGVSDGYRKGVALMSIVTVIITFMFMVVVNQLIQLV